MKLKNLIPIYFLFLGTIGLSQNPNLDSLRILIRSAENDTVRFHLYNELYAHYRYGQIDSALHYATQRLLLIQKYNQPLAEALALNEQGFQLFRLGNYSASMKCILHAIELSEDPASEVHASFLPPGFDAQRLRLRNLTAAHINMGHILDNTGNEKMRLVEYGLAVKFAELNRDTLLNIAVHESMAIAALRHHLFDSAFNIISHVKDLLVGYHDKDSLDLKYITYFEGTVWLMQGEHAKAKELLYKALRLTNNSIDLETTAKVHAALAELYIIEEQKDSSLVYAIRSLEGLNQQGLINSEFAKAYENLYKSYLLNNKTDSVLKYLQLTLTTKDNLDKVKLKIF